MLLECYTSTQQRMQNSLRLGDDSTSNVRPPSQNLKFIKVRIVSRSRQFLKVLLQSQDIHLLKDRLLSRGTVPESSDSPNPVTTGSRKTVNSNENPLPAKTREDKGKHLNSNRHL